MKLKVAKTPVIKGDIKISGAKNAILPLMCTALLTSNIQVLTNVPKIGDVEKMIKILKYINCYVDYNEDKQMLIIKRNKLKTILDIEEVSSIRASYYLMGIYIAMGLNFETYYPGGCSFSKRPIDYHLKAFEKMGYSISETGGILSFKKKKKYPKNLIINLPQQSLGACINIMLAASLQNSITTINNASLEPEVLEVVDILNKMGSFVTVEKNSIIIKGVPLLKGVQHNVISDRMEAGSYMLLASSVEQSDLTIHNINPNYLKEVISVLSAMGVEVIINTNSIRIKKQNPLKSINIIADVYPSFPTDLQQLLCVVCTKAQNESIIVDKVYPNRITQVEELQKAQGKVKYEASKIFIKNSSLIGTNLKAHDLRCGFACIIIGCVAEGITYISDIKYILRGYENLINKLRKIGVEVELLD